MKCELLEGDVAEWQLEHLRGSGWAMGEAEKVKVVVVGIFTN